MGCPDGKVVGEWMQGKVKVRIFDGAYADKTKEELKEVDRKIAERAWDIIHAARAQGIDV